MKNDINVELIQKQLIRNDNISENENIDYENQERNSIKKYDFFCLNNIRICEKIKNVPYFYLRFDPFSSYNFIKIGELNGKNIEKCNVVNTNKYVLFTYKKNNNAIFNEFMLNLPTAKLFVFHIIDSFSYLLENLLILNKNNICFFNINTQNIVFNKSYKPILTNFTESIQINKADISYIKNIIIKTENYIFKPLEIHVLFYLINNDQQTLSYSSIETICEKFIDNNSILSLFSLQYREKYLQNCKNVLKKYINNYKNYIINDIMKYANTWDNYSLSMLYLFFIIHFNNVFCLRDCFLKKFVVLLNKNINPDPLKRESLQKTQDLFHDLMNCSDSDSDSEWTFVNNLSQEKFALFLEKISNS